MATGVEGIPHVAAALVQDADSGREPDLGVAWAHGTLGQLSVLQWLQEKLQTQGGDQI